MHKKLIINVDDLGLIEDVNNGIIESLTKGVATDTSILAVGEAFSHGIELLKKNNIKNAGVHLALTENFYPLTEARQIPTLLCKNGCFPDGYKSFLLNYFKGNVKPEEIYTEFKNQIKKVKKEGINVSHLDGHQHVHIVPGIMKIILKLMKEEGVPYIRFPMEHTSFIAKLKDPYGWFRSIQLHLICSLSKGLIDAANVKYNDYFLGHAEALRMNKKNFFNIISGIKEGVTELGSHVGYFTQAVKDKYPYYGNCFLELKILLDPAFKKKLEEESIELVSYADL